MKGWLDNYNDSKVSVPQGFVGDGYNTKGRNYSPAWGGQFQDGGFIPIAQKGRDIPATRADSLAVYNDAVNSKNYYEKTYSKFYEKPKVLSYDPTFWRMEDLKKAHLEHRQVTPANKQKIRQNNNPNQYLISDMITGAIDPKAPLLRYDRRIKPQGLIDYSPKNYLVKELDKIDKRLFDEKNDKLRGAFYSALGGGQMTKSDKALYDKWKASHPHDLKNLRRLSKLDDHVRDNTPGYITTLPYYDPLAVKPFNLLTDAEKKVRVKKYGPSGVPKSYLNANKIKLNVDPKPNPNKKLNLDPKPKQEVVQPDLPMVEAVNLPPMQQLQSINPPAISDSIRAPKSYDVSTQRYNMQGPSDYYSYDKKDAGYEDILKANAAAKAYNKDIEKRYGPQNEYRTEKSRQEAARRLEQLRQDVKVTPNYQMGGSVYPVNYVPQAQDGDIIPSDLPDPVNGIIYDPEGERTYYDDRLDRIVLTPSSNFSPRQSVINHEKFHKYQFDNLGSNYEITHEGAVPLFKKPSMVSTDEEYYKFHNRKDREIEEDVKDVKSNYPEFKFVPGQIMYDRLIDREQYSNPFTLEGEAQAYENLLKKFQMGGSIPGAVGFSYARTQSPAPSNGKYAKKTMASAKDGEIIKDDMGQWAHPGEITEIDSPYITMEGVPYPVLGISDTGDMQMMYPEEDYEFDGESVTEYPMAKNGIRQEQKGLVNLDQLTNFTNYNKPQPEGWLNKYN